MMNPFRRLGEGCWHEIQAVFVEKRLHQIAPELRPVPNPLGREYLLLIQQHSRLAFVDSVAALTAVAGSKRGKRLFRYLSTFMMLTATTAIINSLLVENRLVERPAGMK